MASVQAVRSRRRGELLRCPLRSSGAPLEPRWRRLFVPSLFRQTREYSSSAALRDVHLSNLPHRPWCAQWVDSDQMAALLPEPDPPSSLPNPPPNWRSNRQTPRGAMRSLPGEGQQLGYASAGSSSSSRPSGGKWHPSRTQTALKDQAVCQG